MSNPNDWNLQNAPFQLVATNLEKRVHVWAGMSQVKRSIEDIICTVLPNDIGSSEFVMLYGEYGGGKTHALRYFQSEISEKGYGHAFFLGKTRMSEKLSFADLFNSIVREEHEKGFFGELAKKVVGAIEKEMFANREVKIEEIIKTKVSAGNREMVRHLYSMDNSGSSSEFISYLNAKDDYDATSNFICLVNVMTTSIGEQSPPYQAAYLFMDEMEDVFDAKPTQIISFFNAIREMINRIPEHFGLVCAFSVGAAHLEAQVPVAIQERQTRPMIELPPLSSGEAKIFIQDYLKEVRENDGEKTSRFFPFSEGAIESLLEREQDLLPRKIILRMRRIFERATRREEVQPGEEIPKEIAEGILDY